MDAGPERLNDRSLIRIGGADAEHFLDNLLTCEVAGLAPNETRFGALLTPQGKILFDFFLIRETSGFLIDTDCAQGAELAKRLAFYRLRADVSISQVPEIQVASMLNDMPGAGDISFVDPRHKDLGKRAYGSFDDLPANTSLDGRRIAIGIAKSGVDFRLGDAYPHEVLMDQFGGVAFKKGCYVGQEVVSRMQHKTEIRKRLVKIAGEEELPPTGTSIMADGKIAGTMGSVSAHQGLAIVRLDRIARASAIVANDVPVNVSLPDWVAFSWPGIK